MYVRTEANPGKVKRIRNDGRMLLAPATAREKRIGPESEARVRILGPGEEDLAEKEDYGAVGEEIQDDADLNLTSGG